MDSTEITVSAEGAEAVNIADSSSDDNARQPIDSRERTLMAVGDLHGDYFRLLRYLRENDFLLPGTLAWNPAKDRVDLIFIGDYTDWRGEPLEAPFEQSSYNALEGPRKIIELLVSLRADMARLRRTNPDFDSRFYPLLGNHDLMMIQAAKITKFMSTETIKETLITSRAYMLLRGQLMAKGLSSAQVEEAMGFLNWWVQGGEGTVEGFGGLNKWARLMNEGAGDFLEDNLYLGVVVNDRLFAHSVPDSPAYWKPMQELAELSESDYVAARENFIWGRKVWGYDYQSGTRTAQFTEEEMRRLLGGFNCSSCVIGHTPLSRDTDHVRAYDERVINIDVHGSPGSKAFIETYIPNADHPLQAPLRSRIISGTGTECLVM